MLKPQSFLEPFHEAVDPGYCSFQTTPEVDYPAPKVVDLDWGSLSKELDDLLVTSSPFEPRVLEPQSINYAGTDCVFLLEGIDVKDLVDEGFSNLEIRVRGPSGQSYPVTIVMNYNQHVCTFRPVEVGQHEAMAQMDGKHISGSPFKINVCRDYSEAKCSILSLDIELSPDCQVDSAAIQIRKPWGIACNISTEQILVADREHHEVLVFTPEGDLDFKFGKHGSGPSEFFRPTSIAYDRVNKRIIVGDKDNHRIQVFNNKGEFLFMFGARGYRVGQLLYPWGIAVSQCGERIIVADTRNHRIQLFTRFGQFLRQYPVRPNKTEFNHPRGVTFDLTGENIYVSDFNLNCIFKLDINLTSCIKIVDEEHLKRPQGLDVDDAGNLLVTDSRHNCVKVFSPEGTFLQEINKFATTPMDLPLDLAVMRAGFVAILDLNGRINVI